MEKSSADAPGAKKNGRPGRGESAPRRGTGGSALSERCIVRPNTGPPMTPTGYNNNFELVQIPGYVLIFNEQIHDARIIPMDGRPAPSADIRQWMGDSRGHWEGNTLVVDTTNFTDKTNFRGSGVNMHLIERFTRSLRTRCSTNSLSTIRSRLRAAGPQRFPWEDSGPDL